jgi:hypothetical protein
MGYKKEICTNCGSWFQMLCDEMDVIINPICQGCSMLKAEKKLEDKLREDKISQIVHNLISQISQKQMMSIQYYLVQFINLPHRIYLPRYEKGYAVMAMTVDDAVKIASINLPALIKHDYPTIEIESIVIYHVKVISKDWYDEFVYQRGEV